MSFEPVIPLGGVAGWAFLNRTLERQTEAFRESGQTSRNTSYFRENIGKITSAADLVADRRLLSVALGAFGLDDDIDKRFFIRKILEEGVTEPGAMANRLVDKRYARMAEAFGFDSKYGPRTRFDHVVSQMVSSYETRQFEIAVGDQDQSLRLSLGFQREIAAILDTASTEKAAWYGILGNPPVRKVITDAFNLPTAFTSLDLDRQVETLKEKTRGLYGGDQASVLTIPTNTQDLVRRYLIHAASAGAGNDTSGRAAALSILQGGSGGASGSNTLEALFNALYAT